MPLGHHMMHKAAHQIDRSGEGERAEPLVLVITLNRGMLAGVRRQVGGGTGDRLDTGLLIIGEHGNRAVGLGHLPQHLRRGIDFQDLGLAFFEGRIAPLQIVAHLVRLDGLAVQHLMHRAGREFGQAGVTGQRVRARVRATPAGAASISHADSRVAWL